MQKESLTSERSDVHLQVVKETITVFIVMVKAHEFTKRQLWLHKNQS